jgi:hypothetical protein
MARTTVGKKWSGGFAARAHLFPSTIVATSSLTWRIASRCMPLAVLLIECGQAQVDAQQISVLDQFTPLGAANLNLNEGVLTISNIGSSGQDGTTLDILAATGNQGAAAWSATMSPANMALGGVFRHAAEGRRNASPTLSFIDNTITEDGMRLQASFSTASLVDIEARDTNGDLRFLGTANPSDPNDRFSSIAVDLGNAATECLWLISLNPPHIHWTVNFPEVVDFSDIHGVSLGQGSALKFTEVSPGGPNILVAASITGTNIVELAYSNSSVSLVPEPTAIGLSAGLALLVMARRR